LLGKPDGAYDGEKGGDGGIGKPRRIFLSVLQVLVSEVISMLSGCQFKRVLIYQSIKEWMVENIRVCPRRYRWDRKRAGSRAATLNPSFDENAH
jgi:hypothetical protein